MTLKFFDLPIFNFFGNFDFWPKIIKKSHHQNFDFYWNFLIKIWIQNFDFFWKFLIKIWIQNFDFCPIFVLINIPILNDFKTLPGMTSRFPHSPWEETEIVSVPKITFIRVDKVAKKVLKISKKIRWSKICWSKNVAYPIRIRDTPNFAYPYFLEHWSELLELYF